MAAEQETRIKSALKSHSRNPSFELLPTDSNHSAPPGKEYVTRVGFDTMESEILPHPTGGGTGLPVSFSLSSKSKGFVRNRRTRSYLVATDMSIYSNNALDFALNSMMEDGDELIILRVIELGTAAGRLFESREGPEEVREDAEKLLEATKQKNPHQISITVEIVVGPIEESIHRMIEVYRPDSLIVGTRGVKPSMWKAAAGSSFMGSISRYCVSRSPVPVIVVRPTELVEYDLEKRIAEVEKRPYVSLLEPTERPRSRESSRTRQSDSRNRGEGGRSLVRPLTAPAAIGMVEEKRGRQPSGEH